MKTLTTLLMLLFIFPTISFSQDVEDGAVTKKKKEKQWNIHKTEIGLDFQNLSRDLNLNSIGSNFILKRHIGEKKFISRNDKKALRIQFGGSANYPVQFQDTVENYIGFQNSNLYENKRLDLRALVGIEWQKQINRIQLFYGLDTGVRYIESDLPTSITYSLSNNSYTIIRYASTYNRMISIPVYGFMGVKFFIHPRVSLSLESSLYVGIGWSKFRRDSYDVQAAETELLGEAKRTEIQMGTDYLRYLNVSFHF